ncbi:MAG: UDP-3-O-(3-hydroxymyristoyl)glucosamine N-acyltransferase [Vampirovibrio sp.]|nr:UDP-3-O-(3-hydroxymyristoyl)glucosamine N-acyltransferase [Vampirovibrio sp.]
MTPLRSLQDIATQVQGTVVGDGSIEVTQLVHPMMATSPQDLPFAIEPQALEILPHTPVKAAIVSKEMTVPDGVLAGYIVVERPRVALAQLLNIFDKPVHAYDGVHPSAIVESSAQVDPSAKIGAFVYVGEGAKIGKGAVLMSHVTVGAEAVLGEDVLLHSGARVGERVILGNRVILQHNVSIGADGFSYVTPEKGSIESARESGGKIEAQNSEIIRINSIGTVILEDDVEVGACSTIDRANLDATRIKKGTKIDNLVMIGHNNTLGENCLVAGQAGISGSCKVGDRVVMAGQVGLKDHISIGDDVIIMAKSGVMNDIDPKSIIVGAPAKPHREVFQTLGYVNKLKDMHKDMIALKKRVNELETAQQNTGTPNEPVEV